MLTKNGIGLVGLTISLALIAWITGVILVYFLVSIAVSLLIVSFLMSQFILIKLDCSRIINKKAFEDDLLIIKLIVKNKSSLSKYCIQFIDFFQAESPANQKKSSFILKLNGKASLDWRYRATCFKRGRYNIGPFRIIGGDPLGFFSFQRELKIFSKLLVYPKIFEIRHFPLLVKGTAPWFGIDTTHLSGEDQEFYGIREYRRGDMLSRIHWRSTARLGELIIKQLERSVVYKATIVIDLKKDHNIGKGKETTLEYAVKISASIASYLIKREALVQVVAYGRRLNVVPFGKGDSHLFQILEFLATVDSDGTQPLGYVLSEINPFVLAKSTIIPIILDTDIDTLKALVPFKLKGVNLIPFILVTSTFDRQREKIDIKSKRRKTTEPYILPGIEVKANTICQGEDLEKKFKEIIYEPIFYS